MAQQGYTEHGRAPGTAAVAITSWYISYDAGSDEYTLSTSSGDAGFEDQGDGTWLLTASPSGTTARQRTRGTEYRLYTGS